MKSQKFLIRSEYASVILSALGIIVASFTSQSGWVATPLTLALSLNLINREKLLERNSKANNNVVQLEKRLDYLWNDVQRQIATAENSSSYEPAEINLIKTDLN